MDGINEAGWLSSASRCPSPNFNERPDSGDIRLIVVHGISLPPGQFGGPYIEQFFTNTLNTQQHPYFETIAHLEVSAHLLIRRDGQVVQLEDGPGMRANPVILGAKIATTFP